MLSHAGIAGAAGVSAGGGAGDPSFVSAVGASIIFGPPLATVAKATTTGNYLFVCITHYDAYDITGVTDTAGNSYALAGTVQGGDASQENLVYFTPSPIAGNAANVCTAAVSGNGEYQNIAMLEFAWPGTSAIAFDAESAHALPNGTTLASNTVTTTSQKSIIVGNWVAFDDAQILSAGSASKAWESGAAGAADDMVSGYLLSSSSGAKTLSMTQPSSPFRYSIIAKAFKPA